MKNKAGRVCRYCIALAFIGITIIAGSYGPRAAAAAFNSNVNTILLLLPDGQSVTDPNVTVWLNAAAEEGLQLTAVNDTQFMQMGAAALNYAGLILPDQVHVRATDHLIAAVQSYVTQGGNLMLVYDAGALTSTGFYAIPKSRLSNLAGVDYVLYDQLRGQTIGLGHVTGLATLMQRLNIPPGKSMPYPLTSPNANGQFAAASTAIASAAAPLNRNVTCYLPPRSNDPGGLKGNFKAKNVAFKASNGRSAENGARGNRGNRSNQGTQAGNQNNGKKGNKGRHADTPDIDPNEDSHLPLACVRGSTVRHGKYDLSRSRSNGSAAVNAAALADTGNPYGITGYVYGFLTYPSFVTQGSYAGQVLLSSPSYGLVAGLNQVGAGRVLFVNSPLGYLKNVGTDGLLLHGFLRYFAVDTLKLPYLSALPQGRGGMILNWHLDAQDALEPINRLDALGVWNHGPFSMHMTAGPDLIDFNDGLGFNLPVNPPAQTWLRTFLAKGHQVGSHGGWIHDYFGANASESNEATFRQYLTLNEQAIEAVTNRQITEYSAPQGNTPKWSVNYMEQQGMLGYYWTGNSGMAPTRAYREGQMFNQNIWAMPLTTYGTIATFEEFEENDIPGQEATDWLESLTDFVVQNRTARLIYMHPPGAIDYPDTVMALLNRTSQYKAQNKFAWYTMTDLARFLNERRKVAWQASTLANGDMQVVAAHATSLARHTWAFSKAAWSRPVLAPGSTANGAVSDDGQGEWLVTANSGTSLTFTTRRLP